MKNIISLIFLSFFISFTTQAQDYDPSSLESLAKKYETDASDEEIQQGLEALQSALYSTTSDIEIADVYSFTSSVDVTLSTFNNDNTTDMNVRMLFPEEDSYYGIELLELNGSNNEIPQAFMIFDYSSYKMISFMETSGQKMGFAMDLSPEQIEDWMDAEEEEETQNMNFTKTGKSKEILGYTCEQYLMKSGSGEGEFWVSDDKDLKIGIALNAMSQTSKNKSYDMPSDYPDGAILEMTFNDSSGDGMRWLATAINKKDKRSIRTKEYTFINMGQ